MITSENHILVILQMFTMRNLNICVKCKIFLDDGVENTVSEWCQKKSVTLWKFKFPMYFNLPWVSFRRYWLRLYWKQTEALLSDTFCHKLTGIDIWNMAEKRNFKFYLILTNLQLNDLMKLVATGWDNTVYGLQAIKIYCQCISTNLNTLSCYFCIFCIINESINIKHKGNSIITHSYVFV